MLLYTFIQLLIIFPLQWYKRDRILLIKILLYREWVQQTATGGDLYH